MAFALILAVFPLAVATAAGPASSADAFGDVMRRGTERYHLDIPGQPVGKALILFGEQTGLSVIVQHDARNVAANPVAGMHTIPEGLHLLLRGTELDYRYRDNGVVVSRKPTPLPPVSARLPTPNETIPGNTVAPVTGPSRPPGLGNDASPPEVVVTGTRIGLPPSQVSSHMVVVGPDALTDGGNLPGALGDLPQNSGDNTPLNPGIDLLANDVESLGGRAFVPGCDNFTWGLDQQQLEHLRGTSLPLGMAPMNLRGIGSRGTLVLVDGKRIGRSGLLGGHADISSIPMDMVERVEIQLDGASALYGSDAIGGVVNIVLRDDYEGTTVKLRRTTGLAGAYAGTDALIASTTTWASGRLTGWIGYHATDNRIPRHDIAGDFLARANPSFATEPLFRESARWASRQRTYFRLAVDQNLMGDLDASVSLAYTPSETWNTTEYRATHANSPNPESPFPFAHLPQGLGTRDLPPMTTEGGTDRWTLSANIDGSVDALPGLEWRFAIDHAREYSNSTTKDELSSDLLHAALVDGSFDGSVGGPAEDRLRPFLLSDQTFDTSNEDLLMEFTIKRSFTAMPAGKLDVLFGVSSRDSDLRFVHQRDALARHVPVVAHDALSLFPIHPGSTGVDGANPSDIDGVVRQNPNGRDPGSGMTVRSAFAELQIPVLAERPFVAKLSVNAAARRENTSLHGSNTTWSVGAVWKINDALRVRLRKGTSFSAPPLWLSSMPTTTSPVEVFWDDRGDSSVLLCSPDCPCDATIVTGGRSSLLPESAVSWSYGIEYAPSRLEGFRTILNYSKTEFHNRIDGVTPLTLSLIPLMTDDLFNRYEGVYRFDDQGEFLGLDARAANIGSQIIGAYDWSADYQRETKWGVWSLRASVTMYDRYDSLLGPRKVVEDLVGLPYAVPKFKQHARLGWTRGNLSLTLNASHRDDGDKRYRDINSRVSLKYPVVLDFAVAYRLGHDVFGTMKNSRVNLGVSNLANGHTRWVETSWNPTGYQSRTASYTEVTSPWTERAYFVEFVHTFR